MVRHRVGSAGKVSKLPVFHERMRWKAGSAVMLGTSASMTSPVWM